MPQVDPPREPVAAPAGSGGLAVDVVDETFLAVPRKLVAAAFADPGAWRQYWPDLELDVYADRGEAGLRWTVRGALVGTMEVWLDAVLDGTMLHYFLRCRLPDSRDAQDAHAARLAVRESRDRQLAAKRLALHLKVTLEDGRSPGEPPAVV